MQKAFWVIYWTLSHFLIAIPAISTMPQKFKIFIPQKTGRKLLQFTREAIEHARREGIGGIIATEVAGRPLGILFLEAWKRLYPEERPPRIYFINPFGNIPSGKTRAGLGIIRAIRYKPDIKLLVLDDIRKTGRTESQISRFLVEQGGVRPENIFHRYFAKEGFGLLPAILKEPFLRGVRTSRRGIVPFRTPLARRARKELRMLADEIHMK
ncbi:MAG: hypothetical protein ABH863_06460 [Candidatus Micrarchaeota archaeon]